MNAFSLLTVSMAASASVLETITLKYKWDHPIHTRWSSNQVVLDAKGNSLYCYMPQWDSLLWKESRVTRIDFGENMIMIKIVDPQNTDKKVKFVISLESLFCPDLKDEFLCGGDVVIGDGNCLVKLSSGTFKDDAFESINRLMGQYKRVKSKTWTDTKKFIKRHGNPHERPMHTVFMSGDATSYGGSLKKLSGQGRLAFHESRSAQASTKTPPQDSLTKGFPGWTEVLDEDIGACYFTKDGETTPVVCPVPGYPGWNKLYDRAARVWYYQDSRSGTKVYAKGKFED